MLNLNKPLTKLQIELLKIYSFDIKDEQLIDIKEILSRYFAGKASDEMDKLWDEKGWTNSTMDEWLKSSKE